MSFDLDALADRLWQARIHGTTVEPDAGLGLDAGRTVLARLTERAIAAGDEVIGWKIGKLPHPADASDVFLAAPVFTSSLGARPRALVSPLLEVEYVARVVSPADRSAEWQLGFEVVDNHGEGWPFAAGWGIADWGLHAGAVVGEPCDAPVTDAPVTVTIEGWPEPTTQGAWRTGADRLWEVLARDCPAVLRPCVAGDLVWTGSLWPPAPIEPGTAVTVSLGSGAAARLDATTFWG